MKSTAGPDTGPRSQKLRWLAAPVMAAAALMAPQAAGLAAAAPDPVSATANPTCPDVEVVFARGTFEAPGVGATGQAFVDALNALFGTPDSWVLNLADQSAPPITIGQPYTAKTDQLCAQGDPVCYPGGLDRSAHSAYKNNGMADQAAAFAVNAPSPQSLSQPNDSNTTGADQ